MQAAIERHFSSLGFVIDAAGDIDLICRHPENNERWHIEAKGKTTECGLDFRTCLGQLVQRIGDGDTYYGMALPDIPQYREQIRNTSARAVDALRIHWLLVAADGSVQVISPNRCGCGDA